MSMKIIYECQSCGAVFEDPDYSNNMIFDPVYPTQFNDDTYPICPFCESANIIEEKEEE